MVLATAISIFFGLAAALALYSCYCSIRTGLIQWTRIRAELAGMDRVTQPAIVRLRLPQEAFALAAA